MILYGENFKICGIQESALKILGYDDADEFLMMHQDLDEVAVGYQKSNPKSTFIQDILNSPKRSKNLALKTKSGEIIEALANASELNLLNNAKIYRLELLPQEESEASDLNEQAPIARLPMLKNFAALAAGKKDGATLDEEWFSKTAALLNLPEKHFAAYLNILIKAIKERAIALENAASAQDRLIIKKITSFLKEPATNLKVTPLVNLLNSMQDAKIGELEAALALINLYSRELKRLIAKYEGALSDAD